MVTKSHLRRFLLAFLIIAGFSPLLRAQSAGYFIDTESGGLRFFQRLAWAGGEYALRYEIVIERELNGTYIPYLRESTETPFIEVSLPPGHYRFRVSSYDILEKPEEVSQWETIEVRPALRPEILDAVPEFVFGDYNIKSSGYVLNISGINLVPGAEFFIRHPDGREIIPQVLEPDEDGNARVFADNETLTPGEYELVIRNPGGLETSMGGIVFPEPVLKSVLSFASVGWTPVLPIHGDFFGTRFSPLGAGMRIGVIFSIPTVYMGAEFTAFFNNANADNAFSGLLVGANLLATKWLTANQTTGLAFRLGVSCIFLPDTPQKIVYNMGTSYLLRFNDRYLLEIGFDYAVRPKGDAFDGSIRPWLGVGMMF